MCSKLAEFMYHLFCQFERNRDDYLTLRSYSFVAHNDEDDDLPLEFHTPEKYILYTLESLTDLDIVELQYNSLSTAA